MATSIHRMKPQAIGVNVPAGGRQYSSRLDLDLLSPFKTSPRNVGGL
jgi:hypothetical protein